MKTHVRLILEISYKQQSTVLTVGGRGPAQEAFETPSFFLPVSTSYEEEDTSLSVLEKEEEPETRVDQKEFCLENVRLNQKI